MTDSPEQCVTLHFPFLLKKTATKTLGLLKTVYNWMEVTCQKRWINFLNHSERFIPHYWRSSKAVWSSVRRILKKYLKWGWKGWLLNSCLIYSLLNKITRKHDLVWYEDVEIMTFFSASDRSWRYGYNSETKQQSSRWKTLSSSYSK